MPYASDPIEPDVDLTRVGTSNTGLLLAEDGEAVNAAHRFLITAVGGGEWPGGRCTHEGAIRTLLRYRLPATSDAHTAVTVHYAASVAAGGGGTVTFATSADSSAVAVAGDVEGETTVDAPTGVDDFVLEVRLSSASGNAAQLDRLAFYITTLADVDAGRVVSVGDGEAFTPGRIDTADSAYASWQAREVCETARTLTARRRLVTAHSEIDLAAGGTAPGRLLPVDFEVMPATARAGERLAVWLYAAGGDEDEAHRFIVSGRGFFHVGVVEVAAEAAAAWHSTEVDLPADVDAATLTVELDATNAGVAWSAWVV